jgi:putative hydrolase of the HAD superfamily
MRGLTELTGLDVAELRRRWWTDDGESAAEAGAFADADEYLRAFSEALGTPVSEEEWVRIRGSAMTPDPAAIDAVRRAAELGTVTLLTNNGPMTQRHLRELAPELVPVFGDELLTSSHYGARKPDRRVFARVLAAHDTAPEDAFFADDLAINVEGAALVGITAHLYTEPAGLRRAIEDFALNRARLTRS